MSTTTEPTNVVDSSAEKRNAQPLPRSRESAGSSRAHPLSLEVPIGVQGSQRVPGLPGQPEKLEQFSEETRTVIVFPQGAVIRLATVVAPGQMLVVTNRQSQQEILCTVLNVKNHPNVKGYVEIEFNQPMNGFWGVYFPQDATKAPSANGQSAATAPPPQTKRPAPDADRVSTKPEAPPLAASSPVVNTAPTQKANPTASTNGNSAVPSHDFWGSSFPDEVFTPTSAPQSVNPALSAAPIVESKVNQPAAAPVNSAAPSIPARQDEVPTPEEIWNASFLSKEAPAANAVAPPTIQVPAPAIKPADLQPVKPAIQPETIQSRSGQSSSPTTSFSPTSSISPTNSLSPVSPPALGKSILAPVENTKIEPLAEAASALIPSSSSKDQRLPAVWQPKDESESRASSPQSSPLSSVSDLLGTRVESPYISASESARSSSGRMMMMIGVAVVVIAVGAGVYFKGGSSAKTTALPAAAFTTSPAASAPTSASAATDASPSASEAPSTTPVSGVTSKSESSQPKVAKNEQVANVPAPAAQPQPAKPAWNGVMPGGKIAAGPAARITDSAAPPDLNQGASSSLGNVQGILGSSANTAPAPPAPVPQVRVADLKQPRLLSTVRPVYPPAATQAGIQGSVVISAVIDETGHVTNTKVVSGPNVLRSAALDAVSKWRYQPAVSSGKPTATQLNITVEFHLH